MIARRNLRLLAGVALACAACGHARPNVETARRGVAEFPAAMTFANTRANRALAAVLEASARAMPRSSMTGGFVHRDTDHLVDGAGARLDLRGVNLGGTLLWEAWIWGGTISLLHMGEQSEGHIRAALTSLLGEEAVEAFARAAYEQMASDADLAAIAAHGFNVVRVPINHRLLTSSAGWEVLDRLLDRAQAHGVYVVLDLHSAPGGQSKYFIADPETTRLWDSEPARARTVALWQELAARYRERTVVAGYDLLNEPDPPDGRSLVEMYARIIRAIREVDPAHLVILEGSDFARDFGMFSTPLDPNEMLSFHLYTWFGDDSVKRVARYRAVAARLGIPMWCGEFGENMTDAIAKQVALFDREPSISGWSFWTWKKVANRYPALHEIVAPRSWQDTVQWIADPQSWF